ncbi:hypothetical protein [Xylophilus sp.]|uniref:hypothetical protein n=1 Tax=Xylophilus sp. TaxID=2653893 RepID=UPI0013B873E9|nr:hypothetical protein [Xylophilus sp.]KAF1043242.1 MAG: hypothetical protein GAK38_04041 [Xylophilus sp.]
MRSTQQPAGTTGFAQRLRETLLRRGKSVSPTQLEREFNLRYPGKPVTSHAVRKWLLGQSLPMQDKLHVLARWLDVDEDWLRWGQAATAGAPPPAQAALSLSNWNGSSPQEDASLLQDWRLLELRHRRVVRAVIETLLLHQQDSSGAG